MNARTSLMRNVLATSVCRSADGIVDFLIPGYRERWRLDALSGYGAHCRHVVLDTRTGYRTSTRTVISSSAFLVEEGFFVGPGIVEYIKV